MPAISSNRPFSVLLACLGQAGVYAPSSRLVSTCPSCGGAWRQRHLLAKGIRDAAGASPFSRRSQDVHRLNGRRAASTAAAVNVQGRITRPSASGDELRDGGATTIFALSSGAGKAAIAVIRVSGPACLDIYKALCPGATLPKPRRAVIRTLHEPGALTGGRRGSPSSILDPSALVLFFPAPRSVTGEDLLELHVHGGRAVVQAVLAAIPRAATANRDTSSPSAPSASSPHHGSGHNTAHRIRYAEPGEFTRRAFFNNRLDLTQVEALGDTLAAVTEQQRRLSVRNAGAGGTSSSSSLSQRYEAWRRLLLAARAELEALIDFSEDQQLDDAPSALAAGVAARVRRLRAQLRAHSRNAMRGELLRSGLQLCLLGAANAGKSSLLNRIVGRDAAIVSAEAGTTRDVLDVGVDIGGWYCRLGDMAGIRLGGDGDRGAGADSGSSAGSGSGGSAPAMSVGEVEAEGIRRAKQRALESDVAVVVLSVEYDGTCAQHGGVDVRVTPEVAEVARQRSSGSSSSSQSNGDEDGGRATVVVVNKLDRAPRGVLTADWIRKIQAAVPNVQPHHIFGTSCKLAAAAVAAHEKDEGVDGIGDNNTDATSVLDPGGIQTFLTGLMGVFTDLTRPIVPASHADDHPHHHHHHHHPQTTAGAEDGDGDGLIWEESLGASKRQALLLDECGAHLDEFLSLVDVTPAHAAAAAHSVAGVADMAAVEGFDVVVAAEKLRAAAECMAKITGRGSESGDVDEVLGIIFEKFCIGK